MTALRAGLGAAVVLVGLTACSSSDDEATPTGSASPSASSTATSTGSATGSPSGSTTGTASPTGSDEASSSETAPPTPAGTSEAEAVSSLPTGRATGNTVLAYSGVGELRQPFEGECSQEGDTTRINGAADTAVIQIVIAPGGARLALQDGDVSATSTLSTGRYEVEGAHLSLAADLVQDGDRAGSIELEIDCGA